MAWTWTWFAWCIVSVGLPRILARMLLDTLEINVKSKSTFTTSFNGKSLLPTHSLWYELIALVRQNNQAFVLILSLSLLNKSHGRWLQKKSLCKNYQEIYTYNYVIDIWWEFDKMIIWKHNIIPFYLCTILNLLGQKKNYVVTWLVITRS